MHVRFVFAADPTRELKFERKVGLGGRSRMLERQVNVYAVPAGRWILASHLAGCDESIEPGEECSLTVGSNSYALPSAVYPADWFVVDVPEGGFVDAGELNLELPRGTVMGVPTTDSVTDRVRSLRFKARSLSSSDKIGAQSFARAPMGKAVASPAGLSATTCERPARDLKLFYNPFTC